MNFLKLIHKYSILNIFTLLICKFSVRTVKVVIDVFFGYGNSGSQDFPI